MSEWGELAKEALKLAIRPRYSFIIWVASVLILTIPLPDFLKLGPFRDEFGKYLGLVCLLAFLLWLVEIVLFGWSKLQEWRASQKELEDLFKSLDSLNPLEAAILVRAFDEKSRTIRIHFESGEAASLISKRLLEKVTPFESKYAMTHPYNVPQLVWERINEEDVIASLRLRATPNKPLS